MKIRLKIRDKLEEESKNIPVRCDPEGNRKLADLGEAR